MDLLFSFILGIFIGGVVMGLFAVRFTANFGNDIIGDLLRTGKLSAAEASQLLDRVRAKNRR